MLGFALVCAGLATDAEAAAGPGKAKQVVPGVEFRYDPQPLPEGGLIAANFKLWMPNTVGKRGTVRGVLCISDYATGGIYADQRWRALAARLRFALLDHKIEKPKVNGVTNVAPDRDGYHALLQALNHFAETTGHRELQYVGLIHTGLSKSGAQAAAYADFSADRCIAAFPYHSSAGFRYKEGATGPATRVPQLHTIAGEDKLIPAPVIEAYAKSGRANHALWAACYQAQEVHHLMGDPDFIIQWVEAVVKLRVPARVPKDRPCPLKALDETQGWLGTLALDEKGKLLPGDNAVTVSRYADFPGDKAQAYWLPTEAVAKAWQAYCLRGDARDPNRALPAVGTPHDNAPKPK